MTDRYACNRCGETYTDENIDLCARCGTLVTVPSGKKEWRCREHDIEHRERS